MPRTRIIANPPGGIFRTGWRVQQVRIDFLQLRAKCGLALLADTGASEWEKSAAKDGKLLAAETVVWGR